MNTILNSLSEADKNKSFLTVYKDGADFDIKLSDFASAISAGSLKLLNGINLSASLTEVTDVIGTISPLQLSTTQVALGAVSNPVFLLNGTNVAGAARNWGMSLNQSYNGAFEISYSSANGTSGLANVALTINNAGSLGLGFGTSATARLHVRGDGTNPIARFESNSGTFGFIIGSSGNINPISGGESVEGITAGYNGGFMLGGGVGFWRKAGGLHNLLGSGYENGWEFTTTVNRLITGEAFNVKISQTFNGNNIGSALYRPLSINYTINNTAAQTGNATGIFLNATETALNGITHNLMDLQVGGVSKARITNLGAIILTGEVRCDYIQLGATSFGLYFNTRGTMNAAGDGVFTLKDFAGTSFGRLQLGGTTSSFPAIKRSGAAIDFRLADDSGLCDIFCRSITNNEVDFFKLKTDYGIYGQSLSGSKFMDCYTDRAYFGTGTTNASARMQIDSTTKGFLPPRMTTAQINAIATPAEGLQVYNTTINHMCFYMGGAWQKINHSPM